MTTIKTKGLNFSEALEALKAGKKVKRASKPKEVFHIGVIGRWDGGTEPRFIKTEGDSWIHHDFYNGPILAEDWEIGEIVPTVKMDKNNSIVNCPLCTKRFGLYWKQSVNLVIECPYCDSKIIITKEVMV